MDANKNTAIRCSSTMRLVPPIAVLALLALPSLVWSQATLSGDPVAGQRKTQMCSGCHSIPGWRTAYPEVYSVPKIGGQHPAYIVKALQAYKSGERNHPSMRAIAASLSDPDMADRGAPYSGAEPKTAPTGDYRCPRAARRARR